MAEEGGKERSWEEGCIDHWGEEQNDDHGGRMD